MSINNPQLIVRKPYIATPQKFESIAELSEFILIKNKFATEEIYSFFAFSDINEAERFLNKYKENKTEWYIREYLPKHNAIAYGKSVVDAINNLLKQ